eukprot:TRINITY_DN50411_c0_g1_i1.p1 TRINITY_DN50411_c0_g1~~TRINITY_DN50411_c0_g1_i1.p1  ORF type:complete len:381 (+),score=73.49 TRINITY_DN50411_c0_g1_i1:72-1214(+)
MSFLTALLPACGPCCTKSGQDNFEEADGCATRIEHGDQPYNSPSELFDRHSDGDCLTPTLVSKNSLEGQSAYDGPGQPQAEQPLSTLKDKLSRFEDITEELVLDRHAAAAIVVEFFENADDAVRIKSAKTLQLAMHAVSSKADIIVSDALGLSLWTPKGMGNDELEVLAAYLPQRGLKTMDINLYSPGALRAGDAQLEALASRIPQADAQGGGLEELRLFLAETAITDVGAQQLAEKLPASGLRSMKLCFNRTGITDVGLRALTVSPSLTQPRAYSTLSSLWIDLDGAHQITDAGVSALASLLPTLGLRKLVLVLSDTQITDRGATELAEQLLRLRPYEGEPAVLQSLDISLWDTMVTPTGHERLLRAARSVTSEAVVHR